MPRKTLILGGILIIFIILAFAYEGPIKKWQKNFGKPKNVLSDVNVDKIDKIEITANDKKTILTKDGGAWKYNETKDFYADPDLIANALAAVRKGASSDMDIASNNKEIKKEFGIEDKGLNVKLYHNGKKAADFMIGKLAGDYSSTYISSSNSNPVYLIKANLSSAFQPEEWRDLTIFTSPEEEISKIRFQYPNREFTVELKDNKWSGVLPEKFAVDNGKIEKVLKIMTDLKAAAIPEQTFKDTGLEKHLIIIQATGENINNILMIGKEKNGQYYAKKGDSDNIYLIEKSVKDELDMTQARLK